MKVNLTLFYSKESSADEIRMNYMKIRETDDILLSKILTFHHLSSIEEYGFRLVSAEFCIIAGEEVLEEKKRKLRRSKIPVEMQFFFTAKF